MDLTPLSRTTTTAVRNAVQPGWRNQAIALKTGASRKFGAAQGSKLFFQTNRNGRRCEPCLNLVNQIRCDAQLCANTLRTRESESQSGQGLIQARSGSPSFVAVVQPADAG